MIPYYFFKKQFPNYGILLWNTITGEKSVTMEALRKIIKVKNKTIRFDELAQFNDKEVECIVLPFQQPDDGMAKRKLMKYSGVFSSSHSETSSNVDKLIYGQ
jgi:hypothetical protein